MKLYYPKLFVPIACLFLISHMAFAQDKTVKLHAISIGPGIASSSSPTARSGAGLNFDISTIFYDNIISFSFNSGFDLNKGGPEEKFTEFNLTYGRKWSIAQNLVLEGHAGVGLFMYDIDSGFTSFFIDPPNSTIGFPIRVKLLLYPIEKFGIGLNPNLNINSLENTYSLNLLFQYNLD